MTIEGEVRSTPALTLSVSGHGTLLTLTLTRHRHGGWDVVWADGPWLGRLYVPALQRAADGRARGLTLREAAAVVGIATLAGRLPRLDAETVVEAALHVLPELARLEAAREVA